MSKTKTYSDAWDKQQKFENESHGWIQWKGTDVCIDIHCICGFLSHFDGDFMYVIQCPICDRKYFVNGHIELIEIEDAEGHELKLASL